MAEPITTRAYRKTREQVLIRDQYTCYLCGNPEADQVDHIQPRSKGGSNDESNLAAVCKPCNLLKRDKTAQSVFLTLQDTPPVLLPFDLPEKSLIQTNRPDLSQDSSQSQTDSNQLKPDNLRGRLIGNPVPRIFTARPKDCETRAHDVIAFAEEIGITLMPWQKNALADMLLERDGLFVRRLQIALLPRQNGKTELAKLLILAHIYLFGAKTVGMMSSTRNMALTTFRQIDALIQSQPRLRTQHLVTYKTNGNERICFKDGQEIRVIAATSEAPRGQSIDFFHVDELRDISQDVWEAVEYTTQARPNAVILATSNAGDKHSEVLNNLRSRALENKNPALGWLEWSAAPHRKITDHKGWVESNPALGHTIDAQTLEHRILSSTDTNAIRTEMLCQFVSNLASPWDVGSVEACGNPDMVFEAGAQTFFAVDVSPNRRNASLVASQKDNDTIKVKLLKTWASDTTIDDLAIAGQVAEFAKIYRPRIICYDRYTCASIAQRLQHAGHPIFDVSGQLFANACDEMLAGLTHKRVMHDNDTDLVNSINSAAMKTTESGWRIVRRKSAGDVTAAIGAAMVIWYANRPQATPLIIVN